MRYAGIHANGTIVMSLDTYTLLLQSTLHLVHLVMLAVSVTVPWMSKTLSSQSLFLRHMYLGVLLMRVHLVYTRQLCPP